MRVLVIVSALFLAACSHANKITTPDGGDGFAVSCGGTANSWGGCYQKAGEVCGKAGYSIIDRTEGGTIDTVSRSMIIRCKS